MDEMLYFYGEPGGKVSGPLGLGSIEIAVKTGRLRDDVMLSRDGGEPWRCFEDVKNSPAYAFHPNFEEVKAESLARAEKRSLEAEAEKVANEARIEEEKNTPTPVHSGSVAGIIEVIGLIIICLGVILLIVCMASMGNYDMANAKTFVYLAVVNILSGLMFLAIAEVLSRLKEIATILSRGR